MTTASDIEKLEPASRAEISWSTGVLRLRDEELFGHSLGGACVRFLHHVFSLNEVVWVEVDRDRSTVCIHYNVGSIALAEFLQHLAAALHAPIPPKLDTTAKYLEQDLTSVAGSVKIHRFGTTLTTWSIVHDRPGRIRLRHQAIRHNAALANRLHDVIENLDGVIECSVWSITGSVLVRFDPTVTSTAHLLQMLDFARNMPDSYEQVTPSQKIKGFGFANLSLALAVAGEAAAPSLLPASAVLLLGSNLNTFRVAAQQVMRGHFGLPVLYTSIVAATLASGQYIASAAMSWMLIFWSRRYLDDLANARRRLLRQIIHQPCCVRLMLPEGHDTHVEVPVEDLKVHDLIVVAAGEQIPVDGRIIRGRGLVDERMICGTHGLSRKQSDDEVFAGSFVELGELYVEVLRHGPETHAARLRRDLLEATTIPHGFRTPSLRGDEFAEQAVAPTMAIAGLGLLIGDVTTTGAILRPDYASGPGAAIPLESLQAIALSLRHGVLIRDAEAIERLANADLLILEDHPALKQTELDVDTIEIFPGHLENNILCYAATAFRNLDDERASALVSACRARGITPLNLHPSELETDLTLVHGSELIKVGDLGRRVRNQPNSKSADAISRNSISLDLPDSLMVGINGQVGGLVHFRRSAKPEAVAILRRLCTKRDIHIGLMSQETEETRESLAAALGASFHVGCASVGERAAFFRNCRSRGFKVAYVSDCESGPEVMSEVYVTISLVGSETNNANRFTAPICLLQPRIAKLGELWDIASIHRRRIRAAHRYALIPNFACIAGAFFWGFTSLTSVLVTNLGTYLVYARTNASLRSLEHQMAKSLPSRRAGPHKPDVQKTV